MKKPIKKKRVTAKKNRVYLGDVGVDSGQLMVCDPCYIDSQWQKEEFSAIRVFKDMETGTHWYHQWGTVSVPEGFRKFPGTFAGPVEECGNQSPNDLIQSGRWVEVDFEMVTNANFSYQAVCAATSSPTKAGALRYELGHSGVAVAFSSGYGDGVYPVYGHYNKDGRIVKVEIVMN